MLTAFLCLCRCAAFFIADDLNISPDFFEYFEALYHVLKSDPTLYCVSAWNDNGKAKHIEDKPGKVFQLRSGLI